MALFDDGRGLLADGVDVISGSGGFKVLLMAVPVLELYLAPLIVEYRQRRLPIITMDRSGCVVGPRLLIGLLPDLATYIVDQRSLVINNRPLTDDLAKRVLLLARQRRDKRRVKCVPMGPFLRLVQGVFE